MTSTPPDLPEVYRDRWIVVVDKPAGLPAQATRDGEPGVYERLRETEAYVGLHHRLDRRASGLMLLTLDKRVNRAVSEAFQQHLIARTYLARLEGEARSGTWNWPVDGKPARTHIEVLGQAAGQTDVRCQLETGRKHQIRVHAAMVGTPVVGDTRYGGDLTAPADRILLHATRLELDHPRTYAPLVVESPRPW